MNAILPLRGVIKQYDWGGDTFIAELLARENKEKRPLAEYWMGTHAQGMGQVGTPKGEWIALDELTGPLSFLLKVLDVRTMLSIQVHPSKEAAAQAFEIENQQGILPEAPDRNYKDANHKPELMVALSPFWLLHGFKPPSVLVQSLKDTAALHFLLPIFERGGYDALYRFVMVMPQEEVDQCLRPHLDALVPLYRQRQLDKDHPDFWAARAALEFSKGGSVDRGIFSIYLFNLVRLESGEGIFQDAGVPHAYLEGQNVEIMANSDNVLRGGLTTKHINVGELIKHVRFEPVVPAILHPTLSNGSWVTPVDDFKLEQLTLRKGGSTTLLKERPALLLCIKGAVELVVGDQALLLKQGQPAALLLPGHAATVHSQGDSLLFIATSGFHSR